MNRTEAIKIIKTATVYTPEEMEALETLIPELRESEDERIRRDIVAAVEMRGDLTQGRKSEIYAYLEKQKECVADSSKASADKEDEWPKDTTDWDAFRREAAKDILCAMNCAPGPYMKSLQEAVHDAIKQADELIKQLKEDEK